MKPTSRKRDDDDSGWAFQAPNAAVFEALARGEHARSLREYFGTRAFTELSGLAAAAKKAVKESGRKEGGSRRRARVLIVPGMMGSRLFEIERRSDGRRKSRATALWVDPLRIAAGHLKRLSLPGTASIRPAGALLPGYARLKLMLSIEGFDTRFFAYDWRLGIDKLGAALASRILTGGQPVSLVAHSMGGLVARVAAKRLPKHLLKRLIMLGTPNMGTFAPLLALRGTYPFVLRLSRLDLEHSPEDLAANVFCTFPGLYQLLPGSPARLLDPEGWPDIGPKPHPALLGGVTAARARMASPDARMAHIVGVNRETVVSVRRTSAGFEYGSSLNGDGTVPVSLAMLPSLETYYADEAHGELANNSRVIAAIVALLRGRDGCALPRRFAPRKDPLTRFDDAQLRAAEVGKIDWRRLDSAQREAVLSELDGGSASGLDGSAQSLA